MTKYYENGKELTENEKGLLIMRYGTVILDDLDKIEFSDCCESTLDTRTHYRRPIKICSKCGKDV